MTTGFSNVDLITDLEKSSFSKIVGGENLTGVSSSEKGRGIGNSKWK